MIGEKEGRKVKVEADDAEEVKAVLAVVSKEVPSLIKGIIRSVFSEEAGRDMGKAAAAFYKELKESEIPEDVALKMTENYVSVFTSLGDIMKKFGKGERSESEVEKEIERRVKKRLAEKGLIEQE